MFGLFILVWSWIRYLKKVFFLSVVFAVPPLECDFFDYMYALLPKPLYVGVRPDDLLISCMAWARECIELVFANVLILDDSRRDPASFELVWSCEVPFCYKNGI